MSESEPAQFENPSTPLADSAMMFVFAWLVRTLHTWWISSAPFFAYKIGDAQKYDLWAREIAGGNWLGTEVFYQAPLYPYFLATIYTFVGDSVSSVRVIQTMLGAAACVFLMNATINLFNRRTGIVTGVLMSLYAPSIFLESLIQKSILDLFLISALIWLCTKTLKSDQKRWWFWIGTTLGLLCLTRENAIVLIPVVGLWALFCKPWNSHQLKPYVVRCSACIAIGLGLFLMLFPVAIRNYYVGGEFHLTTSQLGPNFFIGNNSKADGSYTPLKPGRGHAKYEQQDAIDIAESAMGRSLTPAEVSNYYLSQSWAYISSQPVDWLKLMGWKALLTINATEVVDTEDQYTHAIWSIPLRLTSAVLHFGVLLPIGILGIWLTRRDWRKLWWAYLMIGAFAASVVGFFVFGRYRFPLVPLMLIFAAPGIVALYEMWKEEGLSKLAPYAPILAGIAIICNLPIVDTKLARSVTYGNFGVQALIRDDVELSEEFFRKALELKPDNALVHCNLAVLYWQKHSQHDLASAHFEKALALSPKYEAARQRFDLMKQELAGVKPDRQ